MAATMDIQVSPSFTFTSSSSSSSDGTRSTRSTNPSSASSGSSESPEESKGSPPDTSRSAQGQKRQQRNGRVVGALRRKYNPELVSYSHNATNGYAQQLQVVLPSSLVSPSSTPSKLLQTQLSISLNHHLISLAIGQIAAPDSPSIADFGKIMKDFRSVMVNGHGVVQRDGSARKGKGTEHGTEIVQAALLALGSRRSSHSSILGPAPLSPHPLSFPCPPKDRAYTPSEQSNVFRKMAHHFPDYNYGPRREQACMTLLSKLVDVVEESGVLTRGDDESVRLGAMIRGVFWAVAPYHPFGATLGTSIVEQHRQRFGTRPIDKRTEETDGVVVYDINMSSLLKRWCLISDDDLPLFGFTPEAIATSFQTLKSDPPQIHTPEFGALSRMCGVVILRECLRLKLGPILPPHTLLPIFSSLYSSLQTLESSILATPLPSFAPTASPDQVPLIHFMHCYSLCMVIESNLIKQCFRHLRGGKWELAGAGEEDGEEDEASHRLIMGMERESKRRYLGWLSRLVRVLDLFPTDAEGRHIRSLTIATLDLFPPWMKFVVGVGKARERKEKGETEVDGLAEGLEGVSWGKVEVMLLYKALKLSSTIFARSKLREEQLARILYDNRWCLRRFEGDWEGDDWGSHGPRLYTMEELNDRGMQIVGGALEEVTK